jgi:hypothetical protein
MMPVLVTTNTKRGSGRRPAIAAHSSSVADLPDAMKSFDLLMAPSIVAPGRAGFRFPASNPISEASESQ